MNCRLKNNCSQHLVFLCFQNNPTIRPVANKLACLYSTAQVHKFENHRQILNEKLKLRLIKKTCGTFFNKTAKELLKVACPLCWEWPRYKNTLIFVDKLEKPSVEDEETLVSYEDCSRNFPNRKIKFKTISLLRSTKQNKLLLMASRIIHKTMCTYYYTYFSAAKKISEVIYDLNSGSAFSRKTRSSFTIPRMLFALISANESSIALLKNQRSNRQSQPLQSLIQEGV